MSVFKDKTLLITGGTGSFGNMVLKRFLESDIKEIRIFSRDEKKQDDMRHRLQDNYAFEIADKVKFYIGDVRNRDSVDIVMRGGVDYIFSAAALKQVPSCEFSQCRLLRPILLVPTMCWSLLFATVSRKLLCFLQIRLHILSMLWVSLSQ